MNNEQQIKLLRLQVALDEHLRDIVQEKGAREFLLEAIEEAPSAKAHVRGTLPAPDPRELADEVWATPTGQRLREVLELHEAAQEAAHTSDRDRKLAEIQAITDPRARINAARKEGFA